MTSRLSSSLVVCGLVAAGIAATTFACGSGEGRFYCDDSGCWQCDAYGCSPADKPSTSPASSIDGAAPDATSSSDAASKDGGDASTSDATVDAGPTCGGTNGPCPCKLTKDCSGNLVCAGGECTPPADTCKFSSECGDDKVCADGRCLASCETDPCADGTTCEKGVCVPVVVSDPDAGAPAGCTTDPECGDGNYCDQGQCRLDTRPTPNCTTSNECGGTVATPKQCLDGFCKFSCTDDLYCRTIDSRIGYCAPDGVCRTQAEAEAECTIDKPCADTSKTCIDNTCQ